MRGMACLLVLVASTAAAQDAAEYRSLRASRPDGRTIVVKDLTLERDAYRITLRSGTVHLLAIVGSTTSRLSVEVSLPQKPRRAVINAMHDVLSR